MISNKELQHHGIKGMKWGVRRYQNKDGSLTPAGKKRYDDDGDETTKEKTSEDYKNAAKKAQNTSKALDSVKEFVNRAENKAYEKKLKTEVSQMSDKELQQAVNRLNMEERYSQVMQQRHKLEQGESKVNQVLDLAGDAIAGAVTALTILAAIKELTKK